jgi:hypothetical protein
MSATSETSPLSFGSKQASKQPEPSPLKAKLAELPASKQASGRPPDFDAVVAPLEAVGDDHGSKRLNGPGLDWCLSAFSEAPGGFARCAARAYSRWERGESRRPLGLLCRMVRDGEHRQAQRSEIEDIPL